MQWYYKYLMVGLLASTTIQGYAAESSRQRDILKGPLLTPPQATELCDQLMFREESQEALWPFHVLSDGIILLPFRPGRELSNLVSYLREGNGKRVVGHYTFQREFSVFGPEIRCR